MCSPKIGEILGLGLEAGAGTGRDGEGDQAHQDSEQFREGLFHLPLLLSFSGSGAYGPFPFA